MLIREKNILVVGVDQTQGLDDATLTAKNKHAIILQNQEKVFLLVFIIMMSIVLCLLMV